MNKSTNKGCHIFWDWVFDIFTLVHMTAARNCHLSYLEIKLPLKIRKAAVIKYSIWP